MKTRLSTFVLLFFSVLLYAQPSHNKKVVAYYAQWSIYDRNFNVWNIDADKITHLNYAFFGINYNAANPSQTSLATLDSYADFEHNEGSHPWDAPYKGNFADMKKLKDQHPQLKILISVGGWTKSQHFPAVAANQIARNALVQSMVKMMETYPWIDGFDIDWEYPVTGGTDGTEILNGNTVPAQPFTPDDQKNLVKLVKAMREQFPVGKLVTAALGNNTVSVAGQYVGSANQSQFGLTDNMATYCDFVTFFGYDFGGNWNDRTCYNAPLYGSANIEDPMHDADAAKVQSLEVLTNLFLQQVGIPAEKLVMGLPFYGKLFKNVATTTAPIASLPGLFVNAPRDKTGNCNNPQPPQGSWDTAPCENSGSIEYCDLAGNVGSVAHHLLNADGTLTTTATTAGWTRYWDNTCKVPYLYNSTLHQFISYDDPQSITEKVNFINAKGLAGGMIWEISQDQRVENNLVKAVNTAFSTAPIQFTLNFKKTDNSPVTGITVNLTKKQDGSVETKQTDSNGQVVFSNKSSFTAYDVNYSYNGFSFLPSDISISQNNNASQTYSINLANQLSNISGSVKNAQNVLIPDIKIELLNASDQTILKTVNSTDGSFAFTGLLNNLNYEIRAIKPYFSFKNAVVTNLSTSQSAIAIEGEINTFSISGTVFNGAQTFSGVQVSLAYDSKSLVTTTDATGAYYFGKLQAGLNYTITPSVSGQQFNPGTFTVNQLGQNIVQDFSANNYLVSGTIKNGSQPVKGAIVELTLPWTSSNLPYKSINATTDSNGKYKFDNSEFAGYAQIGSIKMNTWQNNGTAFFPADYGQISVPTKPTVFNFNSQSQAIEFAFTNIADNQLIAVENGLPLQLNSTAQLLVNDGTTINSVVFNIAGVNFTATNTSSSNVYTTSWNFPISAYNQPTTIIATVKASNGLSYTETIHVTLSCTGTACPNVPPTITWIEPSSTSINQASGFQPVVVKVSAADTDGQISNVKISINGGAAVNMTQSNSQFTYNFTPSAYQDYAVSITATDNEGATKTLSKSIKILNSNFTPLPSGNIILGYAHSWENGSAPFLYFADMVHKKYNVVVYSFIETKNSDGYTPQLTINSNRYLSNGVYNPQLLKNDINTLRSMGIPVIVSIGGQNGHVELNTLAQKATFVSGIKGIVDEYGFDGIDLDFEGGSMNFGAGALTDFSYAKIASYPKLKNVVDAVKEIKQYYGQGFILTCAPETYYVQVGYSIYGNTAGAFLPVIDNLRNEFDLIMVQLYNTGSITALDNNAYSQATPDFLTSMSDMLITGFNVGTTGYRFNGLPASKILLGIPSCPSAAPAGGYLAPSEATKALNYLRTGTSFAGKKYSLRSGQHPDFRGLMTWSINWDASSVTADEFGNAYSTYFNNNITDRLENNSVINDITLKTTGGSIFVQANTDNIDKVIVIDITGRQVFTKENISKELEFTTQPLSKGVYLVNVVLKNAKVISKKVIL